ncbi:spermidine/putrescine transport system permease protein [Anaerosphaera aminiphila DSM 21120]|uniref:Spermidine/putrescine transport system permease protein n=1 Tax=Anaerosphaera aminiphila DSM 21120 TaxID=1120995 RepID=A0A1M5UXB7_9FIRM|nr:ABC transporter permease [Anaerosphaera aminiphila]SHH67343.1 spermidine/putrescine transport system permease protein [Anaerosphaera aminiphila DSM 21120]
MVKKHYFKKLYLFLMFLFLYAPIIVLMVFSFNDSRLKGSWVGFTLKWYKELFKNREILKSFYNTILIAVIATICATIIGTMAAIGIYYMKSWKKKIALNINYIPVLNPDIVTAISLMVMFNLMRIKFGMITMLLSHIVFTTPYVILSVLPKLKQMSKSIPEAAMDLGATPMYTFRKVIIPEIKPGIISGALLAFTLSLDDFVISFFTTGSGFSNLSITVYSMAKKGINPAINALSTLMFVAVLILLLIINKKTKSNGNIF